MIHDIDSSAVSFAQRQYEPFCLTKTLVKVSAAIWEELIEEEHHSDAGSQ